MKRERDSQQTRFFKAVGVLSAFGKPLKGMSEVRDFIHRFDRAPLTRRYGEVVDFRAWPVDIKDGRGYGRACASPSDGWVTFPREDRTTDWVVRTVAFIVASRISRISRVRSTSRGRSGFIVWGDRREDFKRENNSPLIAWHGVKYCAVLMDLTRFMLGEDAAKALKESFDLHGVKWVIRAKRKLTPAQKVVAVERGVKLAALRKDQLARARFAKEFPEAPVVSKELFGGDYEDLYRMWR